MTRDIDRVEQQWDDEREELVGKNRSYKRVIIILLIIIIILLLLLSFLGIRMGKIGYDPDGNTSVLEPTFQEVYSIIEVSDDVTEFKDKTELDIFKNEKFNIEKMIAPGSKGTYKFCIKNIADNNVSYNIAFSDLMTNPVNMKYRLKIDNVYIRGNEEEYVSIEELNVPKILVLEGSNNVFTLEWYWEDDDKNDTYTGSQKEDQYYTLEIDVSVNEIE